MKRRSFIKKGATTGATAAAATAAGTVAFPAIAQKRIEVVMVSSWPRDFPGLGTGAQRLAKSIEDMSDGRIHVEYFAAGERVKAFDALDEVASGNAQMYHSADYYWKGKHPAWAFFAAVPFGLTASEQNAWVQWGGGQELWDEVGAEFGVKCFRAGNTGTQMGGWFRKEMNSIDDFKGLKMRIPGFGGDVLAKLGASPVSLPGSQIYENLVSGAIDATEWVGPWNDGFMKFYEAAKYYYYPGMHEPGSMQSMGVNKKFFDGLSKADQLLIEAAALRANDIAYAEFNARNGEALTKLVNEQGVKLRQFSDDIYDSFGDAANEVYAEIEQHSDLTKRCMQSFLKARKSLGGWTKLADQSYLAQRNRVIGV